MMALYNVLHMSLDYLIYGERSEEEAKNQQETDAILNMLEHCPERKRKYAQELLKLFLIACNDTGEVL